MAKLQAVWGNAPSAEAIKERDGERMLADPAWTEAPATSEEALVAKLAEEFSPSPAGGRLSAPVERWSLSP